MGKVLNQNGIAVWLNCTYLGSWKWSDSPLEWVDPNKVSENAWGHKREYREYGSDRTLRGGACREGTSQSRLLTKLEYSAAWSIMPKHQKGALATFHFEHCYSLRWCDRYLVVGSQRWISFHLRTLENRHQTSGWKNGSPDCDRSDGLMNRCPNTGQRGRVKGAVSGVNTTTSTSRQF